MPGESIHVAGSYVSLSMIGVEMHSEIEGKCASTLPAPISTAFAFGLAGCVWHGEISHRNTRAE
jgi:hypothetical protein